MEVLHTLLSVAFTDKNSSSSCSSSRPLAIFWRHLIVFVGLFLVTVPAMANKIIEIKINGAIGPATADFINRGIAKGQDAALILIILDTPGGLDKSTRLIVQDILTSKVPVVTYVSPNGARAASAGTYILYASTVAAMAPGTHLGAASPVYLTEITSDKEDKKNKSSTMDKKVTNDAIAYLRSLAQLRGRSAEFAEKAITNAETLTAREALQGGVINLIATDTAELLRQLNGMEVTQNGQKIKLLTTNAEISILTPDWRLQLLQIITDPTVAYLLLLLGIYGIFFELVNPGFVLPGVIGAIAILVALYALQLLPINYAGLSLIILGILFVIAEAFTPSFGALGFGGTAAFIIGSILLIDTEQNSYKIAWSAIWAMAAVNLVILLSLAAMTVKSRKRKLQHGVNVLLGAEGRALGDIDLQGQAVIRGEIWAVHAKQPITADKLIRVIATKGLQLEVEEISVKDS
ncbi:NfeD family protein [Legionella hackeliae]|uniref:Membrane bound peptidase NefD homolog n=1 Tax=Legionella hackeliae TaxID=449 RepID=A0A0A8UX91_LEGHA|nr:transmembrane protein [Legionella hackeliae]CEK12111.1 membrane bound peptidase; NefD homolog [Legionella hackeliae]STX48898.1 transmembrane protein [Legionella hackeliae]